MRLAWSGRERPAPRVLAPIVLDAGEEELAREVGRRLPARVAAAREPLVLRDVDERATAKHVGDAAVGDRRDLGGHDAGEKLGAAAAAVGEETQPAGRERL